MTLDRKRLTILQASLQVGVTRRTIYNWMRNKKIDYIRTAGGSVRVFADTLWKGKDGAAKCAAALLLVLNIACGADSPTSMTSPTPVVATTTTALPSATTSLPSNTTSSTPAPAAPAPNNSDFPSPGKGVVVTGGPGPCGAPFSAVANWTVTVTNNEVPFRLNSYVFWTPDAGCKPTTDNGLAGPTAGLLATTSVPLSGGVPNFPQGASGVVTYSFDVAAYQRATGHCGGHLQIDLGSFRGDFVALGPCAVIPPPPPPPPPPPTLLGCSRDAFSVIGPIELSGGFATVTFTVKPGYVFDLFYAAYVITGLDQQTMTAQTVTRTGLLNHSLTIPVQVDEVYLGCAPFPSTMTFTNQPYRASDLLIWLGVDL